MLNELLTKEEKYNLMNNSDFIPKNYDKFLGAVMLHLILITILSL